MILPGHLASVLIATRLVRVNRRVSLTASLVPDALDKALHWGLHLTPSDRLWGHTAWALIGSTIMVEAFGRRRGRPGLGVPWLIGYGVHMLGDVQARLPLWYPLSKQGYHNGARFREMMRGEREVPWKVFALEGVLALAAIGLEAYHWLQAPARISPSAPPASDYRFDSGAPELGGLLAKTLRCDGRHEEPVCVR